MPRLTFEGNFCDIAMCRENPCPYNGMCSQRQTLERLKEYEDAGMEPEEIEDSIGWMSPVCVQCDGKTSDGIRTEKCGYPDNITKCLEQSKHLAELAQAEQEGRLVVLPCKVGDHVWADGREAIVVWFFGYETERYLHAQFYDNMQYIDIPFAEIGKTVFLTREEAEAALAQKGGTHEDSGGL